MYHVQMQSDHYFSALIKASLIDCHLSETQARPMMMGAFSMAAAATARVRMLICSHEVLGP